MSDLSSLPSKTFPDRNKRKSSFFEAIYDPTDVADFPDSDWKFVEEKSRHHVTLTASNFLNSFDTHDKYVIDSINFDKCDFFGDFSEATPSFKKCVFEQCDFGLTNWRRARFKNCRFYRCSMSLASFEQCEFRDCKFLEISFSGNETILTGTVITNPEAFVSAGYTNVDPEVIRQKANGQNVDYQLMRLEGTKATIARTIMSNLAVSGDEASYYESVKTYQKVSVESKIMMARHVLSKKEGINVSLGALFDLCVFRLEKLILNVAGKVNNWGASVARPALIGVALVFVFTFI